MSEEQMKEPASRRVGALTSPVNIELHSRYAINLWEGRRGTKSKSAEDRRAAKIMSMPEAIKMTGGLYRDSLADNPYADETMWKVENAIVEATDKINAEVRVLEGILRNIPSVITVRDALSRSPVDIGVFSRSPLGYRCVWLLVGYDQLALKTFQAAHLGLISRNRRDELLSSGAHLIRKIYGILQGYRTMAVTRDDIENKTEKAEKAIARYGMPHDDILSGKLRSSFSPPLNRKSRDASRQ